LPKARLVHLPVHASWLNQIEIVFSIIHARTSSPPTSTPYCNASTPPPALRRRSPPEQIGQAKMGADEGPPEPTKASLISRLNSHARGKSPTPR